MKDHRKQANRPTGTKRGKNTKEDLKIVSRSKHKMIQYNQKEARTDVGGLGEDVINNAAA